MALQISARLALPDDTITKTLAILAKRRVGKTYTGSVLAEEMVAAGLPFYVLDPTGAWWGLRAAANGRDPGLPVVVLGGEHGDVPIDHTAGAAVADLVVDQPGFYVIDLNHIDEVHANTVRFATAFLSRLYGRKARRPEPLHGFWDEADLFAPQRPGPEATKMLGAAEAIVRRGGLRGLGTTVITQRPAVLNKNVLTQIDILVMLRIIGPQDRAAVDEYLRAEADPQRRREVLDSLAGLALGEAWVFGPGEEPEPIYQRVQIRERRTFNSSATPKPGEQRIEPAQLAAIDLDGIRERMAEAIDRAAADDPKLLRARIAELERDLRSRPTAQAERIEVPVVTAEQLAEVESMLDAADDTFERVREEMGALVREATEKAAEVARAVEGLRDDLAEQLGCSPVPSVPARSVPARSAPIPRSASSPTNGVSVGGAKQRILDALAYLEAIGLAPAPKIQVALFAKVSPKSSGFANNLGAMRSAGLIDYPAGGLVALTAHGRASADASTAPSTPEEMWQYVEQLVGPAKWRILQPLITAYPVAVERGALADAAGVSAASSGFANNLGSLRSLRLIDYPASGMVAAQPVLLLERAS